MCTYTTGAHGHELSGCVCADAYDFILIFVLYYYAPCLVAVSYIIMLYCLVYIYSYNILNVSLGDL